MNTELLKSKLLEAAFNGSLTHADTSTWENVQLGEIGTIVTGSTPSKANSEFYGNDYPFYKPGDLDQGINTDKSVDGLSKIGYEHARHLPANSILVTCIGSIGKTGLIRREGSCNQQINAIIPNDKCNCFYVYYLMISSAMQEKMNFLSRSMTMAILNKSKFSCMEIPLPPLAEQQRIVNALEEGFAYIDAVASAKQNLSNTAELVRSKILQAAFDGSLTHADTSTWEETTMGDVFTHNTGKALKKDNTEGVSRPYITTSNLYWDRFDMDVVKQMYFKESELEKFTIRKGDLLICEGGDIGRSAIWDFDYEICFQNHVHRLRPRREANVRFYYYIMLYYKWTNRIKGRGIGLEGFSSGVLDKLEVPYPPIAEQQRIVAKIEELFEQIDKISK